MKGFFVVFVTVLTMTWLGTRATRASAHQLGNEWVFPAIRPVHWIFGAALALGVSFVFFGFRGPQADRLVTVVGGLLFVFFPITAWPKAIYASSNGLRERTWYGGWRTQAWSQVSEVNEKRDGSIVVRGTNGKIVFSPYHADRERFLSEISRHSKLNVKRVQQIA
jgi:hypothetical protein